MSKDSIGAIWIKKTKNDEDYFSISLKIDEVDYSFVGFKNNYKKEDKHPDFRIFKKNKKEDSEIGW